MCLHQIVNCVTCLPKPLQVSLSLFFRKFRCWPCSQLNIYCVYGRAHAMEITRDSGENYVSSENHIWLLVGNKLYIQKIAVSRYLSQ